VVIVDGRVASRVRRYARLLACVGTAVMGRRSRHSVRCALIEAIQHVSVNMAPVPSSSESSPPPEESKNIAKVVAARHLLTLVFYGMRDGQIAACHSHPEPATHDLAGAGSMNRLPWPPARREVAGYSAPPSSGGACAL
jgi:hypothetical protein